MCGRFIGFTAEQEKDIADIINEVGRKTASADAPASFKTIGEIFPTDRVVGW